MLHFDAFLAIFLLATPILSFSNVKMVCLVNKLRAQNNLRPMGTDDLLVKAAQIHSDDLAESDMTGHIGSDFSYPWDRLTRVGFPFTTVTENTGRGFKDEAALFEACLNKPSCKNIMVGDEELLGNAVAYDADGLPHYTQVFASSGGKRHINIPSCDDDLPVKKKGGKGKRTGPKKSTN